MYLRLINDYASAVAATGDENAARAAGIEARDVNGVIDPFAREDRSETAARKRGEHCLRLFAADCMGAVGDKMFYFIVLQRLRPARLWCEIKLHPPQTRK